MMAGLALASSDLPEISEITREYNLGVTYDINDPRDVIGKLDFLSSTPDAVKEFRRNSFNAAKNVFNWENESGKLKKIIGDIL